MKYICACGYQVIDPECFAFEREITFIVCEKCKTMEETKNEVPMQLLRSEVRVQNPTGQKDKTGNQNT